MIKLYDKTNHEIIWEANNFPDNQVQFKILRDNAKKVKKIIASIPDSTTLDLFLQCVNALKNQENLEKVQINYFYGARSDKDEAGDWIVTNVADYFEKMIIAACDTTTIITNNTLKKIIHPFITVLAPHCKLKELNGDFNLRWSNFNENFIKNNYDLVVFPDESALSRFSYLDVNYVVCEKHRDQVTGNIISHKIPELPENFKKIIIIDDLADGGRSFINIAETIPDNVLVDLFIFHGVFSNNALPRLLQKFNDIIVTNSLPNADIQKSQLSLEDQNRVMMLDVWN